jgi:hypothetical protein
VAALPHDAGAGSSGLREDPPRRGEIGTPCAVADATLLRLKRPFGHCTPPEKHLPANESVSGRRNFKMRNSDHYISMTYGAIRAVAHRDAQFDTNNINDLRAQLRSPFI